MSGNAGVSASDGKTQEVPLQGQPVAWVRFCSDGAYEDPLMDAQMEGVRRRSGAWTPLFAAPPAPLLRQAKEALERAYERTGSADTAAAIAALSAALGEQP